MSNDFWQNGKRYNQASGPDADEYARSQGYADFGEWAAADPTGATQWQFQNQPGGQTQVANSDDFDYVRSVVIPLLAAAGGGALGDYLAGAGAGASAAGGGAAPTLGTMGTTGITTAQLAALPGAGTAFAATPAIAAPIAAGGTAAAAIPTAGAGVTAPAATAASTTAAVAPTTSAVTAGGLGTGTTAAVKGLSDGSLDDTAANLNPNSGSIDYAKDSGQYGDPSGNGGGSNWLGKAAKAAGGNGWQTAASIGAGIFGGIQNQHQFDAEQQLKQAQLQLQKDELAQRQGNFTAQQAQQQKQFDSTLGQQQGQQALGATQMDPFRQAKAREGQALLSALISGGSLAGALNPSNLSQVQAFASPEAMAANESQFSANAGAASGGKYVGADPNAVGYPRTNKARLLGTLAPPAPYTY